MFKDRSPQLLPTNGGTDDLISSALRWKLKNAMTKLTTVTRKKIPTGDFALLGRRYPVEDKA